MSQPFVQQLLDLIYKDLSVSRTERERLTDWILDTMPRALPLDTTSLLDYLAAHQPDLLSRLMANPRVNEQLARAVQPVHLN
ncbi:MAG TPA: hypothetical protein VMG58_01490 [Candidatus Sulfotelmatobacter sp.]|nr:hypothetical protein [Candidatus Sulfotelmatobacter sp.]